MFVFFVLTLLIGIPAGVGFLSEFFPLPFALPNPIFDVGAPIVYREEEISACLVADAQDVRPAPRGEFYYYSLINYLRVTDVLDDGRVIAVARNNKRLCLWPNEFGLRKARLTERLLYPWRFPHS